MPEKGRDATPKTREQPDRFGPAHKEPDLDFLFPPPACNITSCAVLRRCRFGHISRPSAYQLVSPGLVICSLFLLTWSLLAARHVSGTGSKVAHNFQLSLGRKLANKANKTKITDDNRQTTKRIIKLNSTYVPGPRVSMNKGARARERERLSSSSTIRGTCNANHLPGPANKIFHMQPV